MYVTDRLHLSLRTAPDPGGPSLMLLQSDTKVEVLETEGKWAKVQIENGRTGWVMKRYLVKDVPKSLIIEQLKGQLEDRRTIPERLRKENASLRKEIDTLRNQIIQQKTRLEITTKEKTLKRLKEIYVTGIVALIAGLIAGYLLRSLTKRPKRTLY
ncbi:MAG: TIGR04211 family SH3 domain-containing protein [Candidatus Binatia bacterium]